MITKQRIKELAKIAEFEYVQEGTDWICFSYEKDLINPYKIIFNLNEKISLGYVENEQDVLNKLFYESRRIGRMQTRHELVKIIDVFNVE